ncbi:hypothetical protein BU24DRAFT_495982 [Aaosphaeria arxii CBS 175.79]|uniref:Uncharacterized protein n=1 Tax=Aaosphaeria arxii CBS 175.79 TaxID=1450172 RepID=A0A6A5XCS3_9PLEO|nr:uncharacterized protein BU24DRAFT_495982 [Aaosphaeria arxii CBS 175.79]KAF2010778.1 hypothetical protein BU24DRAFT_495982 [Aaosphaeria arxii CBS 175.79]
MAPATPPETPTSPQKPPIHNILLTLPRTSSHLLTRILNLPSQPSIHRHPSDGYFFLAPTVQRFSHHLAGKPLPAWTSDERDALRDAFQTSYEELEAFHSAVVAAGKSSYVKIHVNWLIEPVSETSFLFPDLEQQQLLPAPWTVQTASQGPDATKSALNETAVPDEVLRGWRPTFLVRHPALVFPSLLRTAIDNEGVESVLKGEATQRWEATFHWSRALYEFYDGDGEGEGRESRVEGVRYPIVVEADDVVGRPEVVRLYARAVGLDEKLVRYEWERASETEVAGLSKVERRMKDTLLGSRGIVGGKTAEGLVVEDEVVKWGKEFGEVLGERLRVLVEASMADYEWLRERRLRLP